MRPDMPALGADVDTALCACAYSSHLPGPTSAPDRAWYPRPTGWRHGYPAGADVCTTALLSREGREDLDQADLRKSSKLKKKDGLLEREFSVRRELSAAPVCDQIYLKFTFLKTRAPRFGKQRDFAFLTAISKVSSDEF